MTTAHTPTSAAVLFDLLADDPVVASVKDPGSLDAVLASDRGVVFLLYGSVLDVADTVERCKATGKTVLVDVDLLDGFAAREVVVTWLAANTRADGVLSTKANLVRAAKRAGLVAVHRFFLVDSFSYHQLARVVAQSQPDAVEILPGCVPRVLTWLRDDVDVPIVAGGLVCDKADVVAALGAGAVAVASSNRDVWGM
ncbi:glycerol-3-phosphate responsive antiterminator [Curtobacterium sp. Csp1]|uniref:Glycerol-3-phosphate responsive antiterminator n=1 Tax=Curtobacterium citreum TaxID=2036 RepID=A0ABT2HIK9_9MICO|nr:MULTISPECIES: glycerol-3-phosphate responsive antiterminator [Curtobacterium]MCS6523113.1 glycerol-3-phosphate responsive antiterminator [Curtobacterium citreum]QKS12545.1 glycerol-3-phosphate responsive antiterminator [Curtobacterium sp. csp3]QKS20150.1 glycerol-3-phosphate responsive antiterminator [Curtobacterium sp. Csp1]RDH98635.1 glycerol uptake operon antiterminator [Curtobacterium sp. AG1037]TQJ26785.1 glycerol uptake operon antiterminator [Curtobacterium citreum]